LLGENRSALVRLAQNGPILHLVIVDRSGPAGEIPAVESRFEPLFPAGAQDLVGLLGPNLANEDVAPADFAAVSLEFDRSLGRHRLLAVVIVLEERMVYHQFFVEPDAHAG